MNKEKWVAIARVGTFTDSAGRAHTFNESYLDAIVQNYSPSKRDASLVLGHPETNTPAFGWVSSLKREGQKLFAQFAHVPDEIQELVAQHRYRHVSMSLMPDKKTLRHVGLLGAAQPAIDGLGIVEFADGDGSIDIEIKGASMNVEELQQQIIKLQERLTSLEAENAKLKEAKDSADNGKAEAEKKSGETTAEFSAYKQQIEGERRHGRVPALVQAGKVTPAEKDNVLSFAAALAGVTGTVDFSAPDGKAESMSAEERYFRELEARPIDGRMYAFSSPAPSHAHNPSPSYSASEIATKL
ncbi:MAG: hypothetical protein R3Y11_07015 [Pseudomonadota bacterium]